MNAAHLHLLLTHVPVLGAVFGTLLLAYGLWRRQEVLQKASLGVFVLSGLAALAVYLTGEGAEEAVEALGGIPHAVIEAHEEAAVFALVAALILGGLSLGSLLLARYRDRLARWTVILALAMGVITSGVMGWTANLGGRINHPEIRNDATTAPPPASDEAERSNERDE